MAIQRESLVDIAVKRIRQHILENDWQPGDKYLSEKELVKRLEVSRTVVREALISLQSIGIIKIIAGGGVFIADPNVDPIKEILKHYNDINGVKVKELAEIRKVIELGAIRLIVEKDVKIDIAYLQQLNKDYYTAIEEQADTKQADRLFHQFLIKSADNETFYYFSKIIEEYFTLTKINLLKDKEDLMNSYKEHEMIIQTLQEKQMEKAQRLIIQHLNPILDFTKRMEEAENDEIHSRK